MGLWPPRDKILSWQKNAATRGKCDGQSRKLRYHIFKCKHEGERKSWKCLPLVI